MNNDYQFPMPFYAQKLKHYILKLGGETTRKLYFAPSKPQTVHQNIRYTERTILNTPIIKYIQGAIKPQRSHISPFIFKSTDFMPLSRNRSNQSVKRLMTIGRNDNKRAETSQCLLFPFLSIIFIQKRLNQKRATPP